MNNTLLMWGVFTRKGKLKAVAPYKWKARKFGETWNSPFLIRPVYLKATGKDMFRYSQVILRDRDRLYKCPSPN